MAKNLTNLSISVNNKSYSIEIDPKQTLADVLRNNLGLTATKIGCNQGVCGACTVFLDGRTVRGCLTLAATCQNKEVITVEGYAEDEELTPIQEAFVECSSVQCGFCTSGMMASAQMLLNENPSPSAEDVRHALAGNVCRCTGYQKIIDAVLLASKRTTEKGTDYDR